MRVQHVYGADDVLAFPGVLLRRRLPASGCHQVAHPHPLVGKFGRAVLEPGSPRRSSRIGEERHSQHYDREWYDLHEWQQAAYWCFHKGNEYDCLTAWELNFCWSIAGLDDVAPTLRQAKCLDRIMAKVRRITRRMQRDDDAS